MATYAPVAHCKIMPVAPGKRRGKPSVGGRRITGSGVFGGRASGVPKDGTAGDFPELTKQDIYAAWALAADQRPRHLVEINSPFQ